ncbi:MAG: LmbE family N-acetylglucosaminyl deacetylase [Candidatus Nitrosomirales archaeon]
MNILAIGTHPDDIEIGCGGTLIRSAKDGHDVYMYVVSRGEAGGNAQQRIKELFAAAKYLGVKKLWLDNFPDSKLVSSPELIYHIEWVISKCDPDLVFTHSVHDTHHDHRAVSISSTEAARKVPTVLAYENPLSKRFNAQIYVDISDTVDDKCALVQYFVSQNNNNYDFNKAVKLLAEYRALQSRNNQLVSHAEAFEVTKMTLRNLSLVKAANGTSLRKRMYYNVSKIWDIPLETRISKLKVS